MSPMMTGSSTALVEPAGEVLASSRLLGSSISSLSSPRKVKSEILRYYKQASEYFLTRRLPEALSIIEPVITAPQPVGETAQGTETTNRAPIASADRKTKVKVWVFYLTLLNAIADLGSEDGKAAFGYRRWRDLVARIQDGTIWDEIVGTGYGGVEGNIDADVVISLATLLLAQSPSQTSNQRHLESYLAASNNPDMDLIDRSKSFESPSGDEALKFRCDNGTNTPQDLNARVSIVELYTLHVLPRNGEWEYAKDFINMSEVLDDDMKETFLQDLQSLEDEKSKGGEKFGDAIPRQEDLMGQTLQPVHEKERTSIETIRPTPPRSRPRSNSETDYGIDGPQPPSKVSIVKSPPPQPSAKPVKASTSKSSHAPSAKSPRKDANRSIYRHGIAVVSIVQNLVSRMTDELSHNPMGLLRFVLFLVGLIVAFSQRDVKDRLGRLTGRGWEEVKRTVGMGTKISYI